MVVASDRGYNLAERYVECCRRVDVKSNSKILSLFADLYSKEVRALDLSNCDLGHAGTQAVLDTIADCPSIETLSFESNHLRAEVFPYLIQVVKSMPVLYSLNLNHNSNLNFAAAKLLLQLVKANKRLVDVGLEGTAIVPATRDLIQKYLLDNATSGAYWLEKPPPPKQGTISVKAVNEDDREHPETNGHDAHQENDGLDQSKEIRHLDYIQQIEANAIFNSKLKQTITGNTERPISMANSILQQVLQWREDFTRRTESATDTLVLYSTEFRTPSERAEMTVDSAQKECGVELTDGESQELHDHYRVGKRDPLAEVFDVVTALRELTEGPLTEERYNEIYDRLRRLCEVRSKEFPELVPIIFKLVQLFNADSINARKVLSLLDDSEEKLLKLIARRDGLTDERAKLLDERQYGEAETCHDRSMATQEELLDIMLERLKRVTNPNTKGGIMASAHDLVERAVLRLNGIEQHADITKKRVLQELQKVNDTEDARARQLHSAAQNCEVVTQQALDQLRNNARRQQDVFNEIIARFEELKDLSLVRQKQVESLLAERDRLENLRAEHDAFCRATEQYKQGIKPLMDTTDKSKQTAQDMRGFFGAIVDSITKRADSTWQQLKSSLLGEQKRHYEIFRHYYLDLGELLYKKEKRCEESDRILRNCDFQISFARETLDPNVEKYRAQQKELQFQKEEMDRKMQILRNNGDIAVEEFKSTEEALRDAGYQFVHPRIELEELNTERRAEALGLKKQFERVEQDILNDDDNDIQQHQQTVKQAKTTGLSTLISPLSRGAQSPNKSTPRTKYVFA